jgi:selenocysteine-specific translation elongation factor
MPDSSMTDLARATEEEARTAAAIRSLNAWSAITKAIAPRTIRLREIREQIADVTERQRAAEAPYVAQEVEIERDIERLRAKLAATYEARCAVAAPFEAELDVLYDQENMTNG